MRRPSNSSSKKLTITSISAGLTKEAHRLDEAALQFRIATQLDANSLGGYFMLMGILERQGKIGDAIDCCQNVVRISHDAAGPQESEAICQLGRLHARLGHMEEAEKILKEAIRVAPKNELARRILEAVREMSRLQPEMKTRPPTAEACCKLAKLHLQIGNSAEAEKLFQQALHLNADCVPAYVGLATLREQDGKIPAAIDWYRNVVRLTRGQPDSPDAYRHLGLFYVKLGNMKEAVKSFEEAVRVGSQVGPLHDGVQRTLDAARAVNRIEAGMKRTPPTPETYWRLVRTTP